MLSRSGSLETGPRRSRALRPLCAAAFLLVTAVTPASAAPAPNCPTSGIELLGAQQLTLVGDCTIVGDVTLRGSSRLIVSDSKLVVRGNLNGHDTSILYIQRSELTIDNRFNSEFSINMHGDSLMWLTATVFRSNLGTGNNYFMAYHGNDRSRLFAFNSSLPIANSWLIGRFRNQSRFQGSGIGDLPSEVVVLDQATVQLDSDSRTSVWLPFFRAGGTIILPDQTNGAFSFSVGRNTPGLTGVGYEVRILNSSVRLVFSSYPGSNLTIVGRGRGVPGYGEVSIGYNVFGNQSPRLITGLRGGYQAFTRLTGESQTLTLYNVDVDPLGWHVYVSGSLAPVTIRDSVLNEVAAFPGGKVQVEGSVLQWAVLGSTGAGSNLVVRDSHVFAQLIRGEGDGRIELHDSVVHGAAIESLDQSSILVSNTLLLANGETQPCDHLNGLTTSAIPRCNPFLAPGVLPVTHTMDDGEITIDPEPSSVSDLHVVAWGDPLSVGVGQQFTYNAQTGNAGPDEATGVKLRFRTPTQAALVSFSTGCSLAGRDVECPIGSLPVFTPSNWYSVTYRATVALNPAVGEVTVTADQADPDPTNHYVRLLTSVTP